MANVDKSCNDNIEYIFLSDCKRISITHSDIVVPNLKSSGKSLLLLLFDDDGPASSISSLVEID